MSNFFILFATVIFGFMASIWKAEGYYNIFLKLLLTSAAIIGAICSATVLGLSA